jgi:DNA-binding PadR family transcriptional regulator
MASDHPQAYLPLPEAAVFILITLSAGPNHGYAIAKDVAALSQGQVNLSASTLYTSLKRLLEDGLIERHGDDPEPYETGRPRKTYALSGLGRRVLGAEAGRLEALAALARQRMAGEQI